MIVTILGSGPGVVMVESEDEELELTAGKAMIKELNNQAGNDMMVTVRKNQAGEFVLKGFTLLSDLESEL